MSGIMSIRRAILRPSVLIFIVALLLIGIAWWIWAALYQLSDEEEVAVAFVQHSMVRYDPGQLQPLLDKQDASHFDLYDRSVPQGMAVWVGTSPLGNGTIKAVIFLEHPVLYGNRVELRMNQQDGQWKVLEVDFKGDQKSFEAFKDTPYYRGLGIEEWKKTDLSD